MKLSLADSTLKSQVKQLWHDCFGDTDPYLSWYFDNIYKDENTVVALENGQVLGAAQIRLCEIFMHGKTHRCGYVCGVSTRPEARGKKIGSLIMDKIASVSKDRGCEFNVLVPIIDCFYEKNGFIRCFDRTEYFFDIKDISAFTQKNPCDGAVKCDAQKLRDIYLEFASGYDCYMLRGCDYFSQLIDQYNACGGGCMIFKSGGYIMFYPENGTLRIEEAIALNDRAAKDILAYISTAFENCKKVILRCGEKDVFSLILNTLYAKCIKTHNVNIQPFFMSETEILAESGKIDTQLAKLLSLTDVNTYDYSKNFVNILL